MAEPESPWEKIEAMPEFQAKTPTEKLAYADAYVQRMSDQLAPKLAGRPDAQEAFRGRVKDFIFTVADKHFPSGLEAAPSQIGESIAREDRALSLEGARMNTEIGKQAETTLAGLEGKPDDEMLKGDPTTFQTLSPNQDTTVGEYKTYLKSVIDAQAVKGGKKAGDIVESFDESAKRTPSAAMLKLQLSEGWAGWDELIAKSEDPIDTAIAAISGTMLESGVQSAKGAVAGAAATAATGNPLVGGAVMGGVAGESEYQATYLGELQSELQKRGKADAATIQEILKDDEFNARVDKKAMTRGVTIGATEAVAGALSFGIANKIGTTTAKKALLGVGAEAGIGAAGGGGGEFLARLFSGEDVWTPEARKDILSESVAEVGQAGTGTATVGFKKTIEAIKGRPSQSAATPDSEQQSPAPNEEENLQTPPQVNEPATPEPEVDDAPVRSVIEEFSDEADATEVPATDVPAVAPLPESPLPVIEPESTAAETPPATEVNTPAPVEAPAVVDEAAPETVDLGDPEVIKTFDIDEGLRVEVILNPDGTASVEKINTETGVTIPLEGASAPFENPKAALDFLSSTFTRNRDGDIVTEAAANEPGLLSRGEQDPLMIFLQTEKMQPKQTDIRKIGRISQRERKGLRGLEEDTSSQASYENAPLLRDYQNNPAAQERLRGIYSRESGNRPDQIADRAYQQGWISAPTAEALYQGIRERLDGDGGLVSQRRESDKEIADMVAERASQVENDFETFYRAIKSPYRRGGVLPARQFLPGDVLHVGTDTVEVTDTNEDRVTFRSREGGIFELTADETIGFDSMEENGVPASERETIPQEDRVSREDAVALTSFLRDKLGDPTVSAVPSREHSAVAKNGRELEAGRRLSRLFGRRVVGVENFPANGAVARARNDNPEELRLANEHIFIATDSSRTELLIVAHELLHQMRQTDDDLYSRLNDALDADLEAYIQDVRGEHSDKSIEMLREEFLADYLSDKMADPAFWESLAKRDPSLFEDFVNFIRQFLREVRDKIQSQRVGVERYLRDAAEMQRTLEDVLVAFRARQSQDRAGILDVPLDESMPFADLRFSDERATKPNQQVFGQDIGREDEIQSKEEVQSAVKGGYFDGDSVVSYWSKEAAFSTLGDIEAGRIEPTADTGLDGANQALVTELWKFANAMLREEGDASLLNRMRGRVNDYWNREATRAARALNARGWAQSPMEGTLGKVEEGKREAVEKIEPGTQAVEMVEQIQRDVDASQVKVEDFSQAEIATIAAEVKGKRQTTAPGAPVTAGELALNAGRKVGKRLRAVAAKLDALLSADNDVLFSDPRATPEGKRSLIEKLILNQASTGRRKRGAFIRVAVELGMTEEVAANRFDRIAEIRQEAKAAREADAKEAREGKAELSAEDKFLAALDEEASRLDKLNDKAKKISDRLQSGPKKRKPVDPAKRQPLDNLVFTALETVATRESIIKDGIRLGLTQEAAARLADAIAVESQARAGRRKKGEKKSIDARASEIANRFENPQDRPVREKNELRALINETLRRDSKVKEPDFLDRMKAMGASAKDSADLWAAVSNERARRQELRDLRRKAQEEKAKDDEAMNLIRKLAKSQSDTQDNRPGKAPEPSIIMEIYRDTIGYGPVRSRAGFVRELEAAGVETATANRLFDLALRERQNRTVLGKDRDANRVFGRPNLPATDKSVPFIMREILAHPSIKLVGPEERLGMMSALFQERAGLSPIDARAAAVKFDAILVKKWDEAALRLAEETATKRNAPWFRRKEAIAAEDLIALLDESVKAGTATADIAAVRALYQGFEGSSFSREKMTADLVRAGVPANLAGKMADLAIASKRAKKTTFDRLREAIRAGAMDPRKRLLDEVAKSNGWMDLTDTELQRLAELDALLADPNLTPFEDIRHKREMARIINASALPSPLSKSIREYYLASIFSGVKTWVLQTSVVFNAMANLGVRDPLVALASAARGDRAPLTAFVAATGNLGSYVRNAITDGSLALLTGDIRGIQEAEILAAVSGLEQIHDRNMVILRDPRSTLAQKTAAATKVFFAANRLFFRILSGLDNTFQGFIRTYTAELEAFSKAADLGIPRGKMREMTAEALALGEAFAEEADAKGFTGFDKRAFVNDRISMAIFAALQGEGVNLDGIRDRSFREAAIETGVAEFQTGMLPLGKLAKHLQKWSNEGGIIATMLVPVVRTPYQVLHRSAWWSPYGIARLVNVGFKTGGFRDWSKSPYETAMADPVQLLRRSAETALGTAAFIALAALMARNEGEEEEDKDFRINLGGPTTANRTQYTAWRETGRRPFTMQFRDGDRWITIGFRKGGVEFFNFAATILGSWDQRKYNGDSSSDSDLMQYVGTLIKEMAGESLFFLRGFTSRYALMNEDKLANHMGFMLSGYSPAASMLKTPNRLRDYQDVEPGAMTAFLSQMPVVPLMSPDRPQLNSLGDPLGANERERSFVQSQFGMPVGWVPFKKRATNSVNAQDEDLYLLLFEKGYFPGVKSRKDFGEDVTLEQYRKFVTTRGQAIKNYLRANYTDLSAMEPEKFKELVSEKSSELTTRAQKFLSVR